MSRGVVKSLSPTSYVILAHLAVKPWPVFELAKQITRGLDLIWPRAESAMYVEPKVLVEHGLAEVRQQRAGPKRTKQVYSITEAGREELRAWLARPSTPPQFESEALVRVFFAEHATRHDLLAAIDQVGAYGSVVKERLLRQIAGYLVEGGPFSDRWHVIGLGARFLLEYAAGCERWARWAREEVVRWPSVDGLEVGRGADLLEEALSLFGPSGLEASALHSNHSGDQ